MGMMLVVVVAVVVVWDRQECVNAKRGNEVYDEGK